MKYQRECEAIPNPYLNLNPSNVNPSLSSRP